MPLKNENKSSNESTTNKSRTSSKKKLVNGDSLRNELHGMIPDLSSSNEHKKAENNSLSSTSSSLTPSSDDESGVFDTRFDLWKTKIFYKMSAFLLNRTFHPVERSDDLVVFDHDENNADVSYK